MGDLVDLHGYFGLDESGNLQMCVSPWKLNNLSAMHQRGNPMPETVLEFLRSGEDDAKKILADLTRYYEPRKRKKT